MESEVVGSYHPLLVALSYIVAFGASFSALDLTGRVHSLKQGARTRWLIGGAMAFGFGIWGMHFVGMIAFRLPFPIQYDVSLVFLSFLLAVAGSGVALRLAVSDRLTPRSYVACGVLIGGAICGMHYVGMSALIVPADVTYDVPLVGASAVIAVITSIVATWLAFRLRDSVYARAWRPRFGAAAVMGLAIAGMHYTAMSATRFTPYPGLVLSPIELGGPEWWIAGGVAAVALVLAGLTRIVSVMNLTEAQGRVVEIGVLMTGVVVVVGAASVTTLYRSAFREAHRAQEHFVQTQARLMEAVARFEAGFVGQDAEVVLGAASVGQVRDAHQRLRGEGERGEFLMARLHEGEIEWLLQERPPTDGATVRLAEPMRRALAGESGSMVALDYRGETVVAAYEPVAFLNVGMVANVSLREIRAPFYRTTGLVVLVGFVLTTLALVRLFQVGNPMVAGLEEREFLDALLAGAPNPIVIQDTGLVVLRVNQAFERLFGFTEVEVVGKRITDLVVPPSSSEAAKKFVEILDSGGGSTEMELQRRDSSLLLARLSASPRLGSARGANVVIMEDITEVRWAHEARLAAEQDYRRLAESSMARFQGLLESAPDAFVIVNEAGKIVLVNAQTEHLFGYDREELVGQPVGILVPEATREDFDIGRPDDPAGPSTRRTERLNLRAIRKDGLEIPVEINLSPLESDEGLLVSAAIRDVTDRVMAQQALEMARESAEQSTRAKTAFLANMSHEIRTPMNGVMGVTELLLDSDLTPDQRRSAEMIRSSAESLLTVLNDVLDVSKIEAGHLELEEISFDLPRLLVNATRVLAVRAADQSNELALDVHAEVPTFVFGDPGRLRQVITNLVSNAIKFTTNGDIVVSARAGGDWDGAPMVHISVRDTGVGIPADKTKTIFEEFRQADASITRQYGGTGLGLTISRKLVDLMGGKLQVHSEVGVGSDFFFSLPFKKDEESKHVEPRYAGLPSKSVLIIDDNTTSRMIFRRFLENAGLIVEEAEGATEALATMRVAAAEAKPFDLALVDVRMPDLSGFELIEQIKADPALAPTALLLLTSEGTQGEARRAREMGVDGLLSKPVSRAELLQTAAAVLGGAEGSGEDRQFVTRDTIREAPKPLRILLAEDNLVNQHVAKSMLTNRGHHVDVVVNGLEAVEAAREGAYDLILMDVQMPEMDGITATQRIREIEGISNLPILAMTAHAMAEEQQQFKDAGMNGFVAKPFKPQDLFASVEEWGARVGEPASQGAQENEGEAVPDNGPSAEGSESRKGVQDLKGTTSPVDLEGFRATMKEAGIEEVVESTVAVFRNEMPDRLNMLEDAVESRDQNAIKFAAHALKSAAGNIRADRLAELLFQLEMAGENADIDEAVRLANAVAQEAESVIAYLNGSGDV